MAYAYNDDKSKRHIVVIAGKAPNVTAGGYVFKDVGLNRLVEDYGIDDPYQYTVIGTVIGPEIENNNSYLEANSNLFRIRVVCYHNHMSILVYNDSSSACTLNYRIVLTRTDEPFVVMS